MYLQIILFQFWLLSGHVLGNIKQNIELYIHLNYQRASEMQCGMLISTTPSLGDIKVNCRQVFFLVTNLAERFCTFTKSS